MSTSEIDNNSQEALPQPPDVLESDRPRQNAQDVRYRGSSNNWQAVVEQAKTRDAEFVDGWQRSMDVLLIFAALFAGILAAFLVESTKELKSDPPSEPVRPTSTSRVVNRLWYSSLALTFASAVGAMVAKQWLSEYMANLTFESWHETSREIFQWEARLREFRYNGMMRWHVPEVIGFLPIVLHIALLLFGAGLVKYLWDLDLHTSILVLTFTSVTFIFYVGSMILPSMFSGCPYKTPISHLFANANGAFRIILEWRSAKRIPRLRDALGVRRVLLEEEKAEVEQHASDLDEKCLKRLKETARSKSTAAWATEQLEVLVQRRTSPASDHQVATLTVDLTELSILNASDGAREADDGVVGNAISNLPV